MNFTLHQLRIFKTMAETGSITKAAEILHLTQPAVSIQIKNFQEQFDMPLFETIGRKIHITSFGKEIATMADQVLEQLQEINQKNLSGRGEISGRLKIAIVSTGKYIMPYFLSDFLAQHQAVELTMDVTNKTSVIESLENNEVDFALVSILPNQLAIEKMELLQNKLFLVGNQKIKLHKNQTVKDLFSTIPLIFREKGSGTRQVMERFIKGKHLEIYRTIELTSNEAVKQAVIAGLGFSIMPLIGIRQELFNKTLHIIPVKGLPVKTTWTLIWLKGKRHLPASRALLEFLKKNRLELAEKYFSWYENYA